MCFGHGRMRLKVFQLELATILSVHWGCGVGGYANQNLFGIVTS